MLLLVPIYWLAVRLYFSLLRLAALFNKKAALFAAGRKDLLANIRYALIDERRPRIWMHCASLGEFEQGRPVLEKLRQQYPGFAFVLTFFSPSGYEVRKDYNGADYIFYLPNDSPHNAKRFLKYVQPELCIFVKYEFWYFLLSRIAHLQIPCILISAVFRQDQPFFKWYGMLHRAMLHCFSYIFTQDAQSAVLLGRLGVEDVAEAGDTRFDRVIESVRAPHPYAIADTFCKGSKVLLAGSTWEEDEILLHRALAGLPAGWKLVVVPHEVHESHIGKLEALFGNSCVRWSSWLEESNARVLIVDEVGFLLQLYRYADVAWVGGGFGKEGVHNVLEPAVYRKPVVFGPVYSRFLEAVGLVDAGGAVSLDSAEGLISLIAGWEQDPQAFEQAGRAAKDYVYSRSGATVKILDYLSEKKTLRTR